MNTEFNMVVIGAGIHGAGIAQAAAAKGHSVLLLEQYPAPAQGTSSKSSKLIHGGLRYLEQGDLKLVYECLRERKYLIDNAPSLVQLKSFYIPLYKDSDIKPWKLRAGLSLYSLLAGLGKSSRFRTIPKSEWSMLPNIKQSGLKAIFCYQDAQTDDAELTQAVIASAQSMNADVIYNAEFKSASKTEFGYDVEFETNNSIQKVKTRTLVHATGPWVNHSMDKVTPKVSHPDIDLVQGIHIVLPGNIGDNIFYLNASDGRAIFVTPWQNNIMVGTTEYIYHGDPAQCKATQQEIDYLLAIFNYFFPQFISGSNATNDDIIDCFAGLRVLPKNSKNPFARTRETIFIKDNNKRPHLIGIYGGKLTSYRATAEKVLQLLHKQLPKTKKSIDTRTLPLNKVQ